MVAWVPDPSFLAYNSPMNKTRLALPLAALLLAAIACINSEPIPTLAPLYPPQFQPARTDFDCLPQGTQRQSAELVEVIDGDTIEVRIDGKYSASAILGWTRPSARIPTTRKPAPPTASCSVPAR